MKKNLLFILIDCLRADALLGQQRYVKTPLMDFFCERGTSFTQAISTASTTSPSVTSILTGLYPFTHNIQGLLGYKLNPFCTTMQEIFKMKGYNTCAMVTGPLTKELNIHRGFDKYYHRAAHQNIYTDFANEIKLHIKDLSKDNKPWFIFLHLFELHLPRQLLRSYNSKEYGRNRYERALSSLDHRLGEILEDINLDNTIVILHADHGENVSNTIFELFFWKYRRKLLPLRRSLLRLTNRIRKFHSIWMGHGYHIYDFLIRVPLIFAGNGIFPAGRRIPDIVRQVDILPTIIECMQLSTGKINAMHGRSLMPLIKGEKMQEEPAYITACGREIKEKDYLVGLRKSNIKFVYAPMNSKIMPEMYDLKNDPSETKNLVYDMPDIAEKMKHELLSIQSKAILKEEPHVSEMVEEEKEKLKKTLQDLGYL